jgi:hypothetical protein
MSIPAMAVPRTKVDQEVIDYLRQRMERRRARGYTNVAIALEWAEQLLAAKEKELARPD